MKRNVSKVLSVLLIAALMLSFTAVASAETRMYATDAVNVRSGPSTGYYIVGRLEKNDMVMATGRVYDGWYEIQWGSYGYAYVAGNYLSYSKYEPGYNPNYNCYPGNRGVTLKVCPDCGDTYYSTTALNVRRGPSTKYSIVGSLNRGQKCTVIGMKRVEIAENGFEVGSYTLRMDEESVAAIVSEAAAQLDHPPIEPYVTLLNRVGGGKPGYGTGGDISTVCKTQTVKAPDGTVVGEILFHTGSNGFCLNREDMLKQISEAFNSGNYNASLSLLLEEVEPEGDVNTLIDSMRELSRFSTEFATSNESRSRNVQKAAGLLNCVILEPGEELSYNELLGPRTEELGWLPAHGISGGKEYIDTPGGGICQVSSTLYNSLLLIGPDIRIVSRSHHSIPGSYVAMGLDATVSYYGPDLVWSNAAESPMFLFAYADMRTKTVYTFVYGTQPDDGTHYKIWSDTIEKLDPPEPKRIAEPLWPTGYSKMVISPRYGYVVEVYRQLIGADGQPAGDVEKLYTDKYVAVQGELHYGTGSSTLPVPNR